MVWKWKSQWGNLFFRVVAISKFIMKLCYFNLIDASNWFESKTTAKYSFNFLDTDHSSVRLCHYGEAVTLSLSLFFFVFIKCEDNRVTLYLYWWEVACTRWISQGARKIARIPRLSKKKKMWRQCYGTRSNSSLLNIVALANDIATRTLMFSWIQQDCKLYDASNRNPVSWFFW